MAGDRWFKVFPLSPIAAVVVAEAAAAAAAANLVGKSRAQRQQTNKQTNLKPQAQALLTPERQSDPPCCQGGEARHLATPPPSSGAPGQPEYVGGLRGSFQGDTQPVPRLSCNSCPGFSTY